jgi:hypothetical protein
MHRTWFITFLKEIGGFVRQVIWNGMDYHLAYARLDCQGRRFRGFRFVHLHTSHKGTGPTRRLRFGLGQYLIGAFPLIGQAVSQIPRINAEIRSSHKNPTL